MQIVELACPECSRRIVISNPREGEMINCGCGSLLRLEKESSSPSSPEIAVTAAALGGVVLGWLLALGTARLMPR